jgi:uncharacterized coiled-coil protein SlyX
MDVTEKDLEQDHVIEALNKQVDMILKSCIEMARRLDILEKHLAEMKNNVALKRDVPQAWND